MSTSREVKKKTVTKKPKTSKTTSHPSYFDMIKEALLGLKEKSGSSPHAIAKHMEEKHKGVLPSNFRSILATQLKKSAAKGNLVRVKASFKLSEAAKKVTKPKKAAAVKPKKRLAPKKMKSPAAKRAKKATVKA